MSGLTNELIVSRSVRDTARMLDAVAGPAPGDPYVAPAPARPYADELEDDPGRLRIGVMTQSLAGLEVDPRVVQAARDAAALLESLGHDVEDSAPGGFEGMNLVEHFMVRWCRRRGRIARAAGVGPRARAGPGGRRAAHLGARRGGERASAAATTWAPSTATR